MSTVRAVHKGQAYLRRHGLHGRVEVATAQRYFNREYTLLEVIRRSVPDGFSRSHVQWEYVTHAFTCPVVRIELGLRGRVSRAVVNWAQEMVRRYGPDRVSAAYYSTSNVL
jgi:hypothetical protein